jgi:hypothetical protein
VDPALKALRTSGPRSRADAISNDEIDDREGVRLEPPSIAEYTARVSHALRGRSLLVVCGRVFTLCRTAVPRRTPPRLRS